ncbi:MAG: hypothetical protein Q9165_006319 [Trypethelium subeluteriae]
MRLEQFRGCERVARPGELFAANHKAALLAWIDPLQKALGKEAKSMLTRLRRFRMLHLTTSSLPQQIRGEAQGDESQLNDFLTYLRKGPLAADLVGTEIDEIRPDYNEHDFCTAPDDYEDSGIDSSSVIYHAPTTPSSSALTSSSSGGSAGTPGTSGSETRSMASRASSGSVMKFQWKVERVGG